MTEHDRLDELLAHTLRRQLDPIADNGFSNNVMRHVRQRRSLRALAISMASVAGLLIALIPASQLLEKFLAGLTGLVDDLETSPSAGRVGTVLEALQVRETLAGLSEQIMSVFALSGNAASLVENHTALLAALLALAGTAAVRLLVK